MVAVFREVRRVLRDDGTLWLNMGDSYASSMKGTGGDGTSSTLQNDGRREEVRLRGAIAAVERQTHSPIRIDHGLKPKDLLMMPARLALALQADGWWLRSDIIWAKPNPMPESVTDRPTSAHEHVFLLTKAPRYYYDADAVREEPTGRTDQMGFARCHPPGTHGHTDGYELDAMKGRNLRNVWTIATQAFPEVHYATFPTALAERCIKAGTSEKGCCARCGAPWVRQTSEPEVTARRDNGGDGGVDLGMWQRRAGTSVRTTTGWSPSCTCRELRCVDCSFVLDTKDDTRVPSTTAHMRSMRQELPGEEAPNKVLQPPMLDRGIAICAGSQVRVVRKSVPATEREDPPLLKVMRAAMEREEPLDHQGLDDNQQGLQASIEAGSSECDTLWLRDGTSAGDGEEAGQASDQGRGGSPQEWQSARQPDRQSGTDGEAPARRASQAGLLCDVPALPTDVPDARTCPHCGSHAEWTTPDAVPATVLDCFAGAGTTMLVADRLQRHAIGIELNAAYAAMSRNRIMADAPLLAEVAD